MDVGKSGQSPFRIITFRDGRGVMIETADTPEVAREQMMYAIEACRTLIHAHIYRVELWDHERLLDVWPCVIE
jgi:hypothetical protein